MVQLEIYQEAFFIKITATNYVAFLCILNLCVRVYEFSQIIKWLYSMFKHSKFYKISELTKFYILFNCVLNYVILTCVCVCVIHINIKDKNVKLMDICFQVEESIWF